MLLDDLLHHCHDLIVRDAGLGGRHRLFDLRTEPRVIGFRLFGGFELGLDGRELGHSMSIAGGGRDRKLVV